MMKINGTAFNKVMGNIDVAYQYTKYFPLILVGLLIFNIFDCYGKILGFIGLSRFKFSEDFDDERIEDGRKLIERAR